MKTTKIMLMVVITFLVTWSVLALIIGFLLDYSFRESCLLFGVILTMLIVGWIPSVVVAFDLADKHAKDERRYRNVL